MDEQNKGGRVVEFRPEDVTPENVLDRLDELSQDRREEIRLMASMLCSLQKLTADRLRMTKLDLENVLTGRRDVSYVVYQDGHRFNFTRAFGRFAFVAVSALLVLCFAVPGLADSVRQRALYFFWREKSFTMQYVQRVDEVSLKGVPMPTVIPEGYTYQWYQVLDNGTFYMLYTNERGESLDYFYYPRDTMIELDNEHTGYHQVPYKNGAIMVGIADNMSSIVGAVYEDGGYVQFISPTVISDADLVAIFEGLRCG